LAFIEHAALLLPPDDPQLAAWVMHQKARLLVSTGQPDEAEKALVTARASYGAARDRHGEAKALLSTILVRDAQGASEDAIRVAREAIRFAEAHELARLVLLGRIELGRLLTNSGSIDEGLGILQQALGQAIQMGDRNAEFAARYCLWKAHLQLGDHDRARFEFEAASYCVRFVDEASPEAEEIRELGEKGGLHGPRRATRHTDHR
jgi:tetratricopeptide (TPR) repeat protein